MDEVIGTHRAAGKTAGMALLGCGWLRQMAPKPTPRRGVVRTMAFPLSFLFFGLGFLVILVQRDRRALHDLIAGTVVYLRLGRPRRQAPFPRQGSRTDPADPAQSPFAQAG